VDHPASQPDASMQWRLKGTELPRNTGTVTQRSLSTAASGYGRRTPVLLRFLAIVAIAVVCLRPATAADQPLTKEQIKKFLLTARVVASDKSAKGVSHTFRLTLSDGAVTHDASFQDIDEHKEKVRLSSGQIELNFVDSYKYNLAAYILAELVGFDDMMPVYVERTWNGTIGSLSWWVPAMMDDQERYFRQIQPPDLDRWNRQIDKIRVFNQLTYETDPNLTNILIADDWKVWRVDFSRAFRLQTDVQLPNDLRCERRLFDKLKRLDANDLAAKTTRYLTASEVQAVMARRDKIVAHFQRLITEKGESAVLD
jgi:hypothetical protein